MELLLPRQYLVQIVQHFFFFLILLASFLMLNDVSSDDYPGNYDIMQHPKNISKATERSACFYMFVDEGTVAYISNSTALDRTKRVGLWRVVAVQNLPYVDPRRNGKVPSSHSLLL